MSLEQALAENTAAIKELTAVWAKLNAQANKVDASGATEVTAAGKAVAAKTEAAATPKAEKAAATHKEEKPAATAKAASPSASTASSSTPAESAPALDYAPVGAAITAYAAKHGRDDTIAKLGEFGVSSGKALKPEQYADALAAFTAEEEEVA